MLPGSSSCDADSRFKISAPTIPIRWLDLVENYKLLADVLGRREQSFDDFSTWSQRSSRVYWLKMSSTGYLMALPG